MRVIQENRNGNNINCYIVDVTNQMKEQALQFATDIINSNNQYSRLIPDFALNDTTWQQRIEIQRTYVGKLGELAFLEYLNANNIYPDTSDMFEIYQGQDNVDGFDFEINGYSIDVKTGFRTIHSRLLINMEQFTHIPKDYYVAVHLNGVDMDSQNKLIDLNSITQATIKGYADYNYLNTRCPVGNFGEGDAKYIAYNRLLGIDRLLNQIR